jgi:hypothetical protein
MGVAAAEQLVKPKLRGVFHELGYYTAAAVGVVLVVTPTRESNGSVIDV